MLTIFFVVTVTCYNCAVVYVTKFLSAIWHAILDNFRPITIWYATITVLCWCRDSGNMQILMCCI